MAESRDFLEMILSESGSWLPMLLKPEPATRASATEIAGNDWFRDARGGCGGNFGSMAIENGYESAN